MGQAKSIYDRPFKQDFETEGLPCSKNPELFFPEKSGSQAPAIEWCRGCPVRAACLALALNNREEFGVWGGMSSRQRRALRKKHPEVKDWRDVIEGSRDHRRAA